MPRNKNVKKIIGWIKKENISNSQIQEIKKIFLSINLCLVSYFLRKRWICELSELLSKNKTNAK